MSEAESSNIQNHLTIDFPIRGPASAKALTEELPPLMPDLATEAIIPPPVGPMRLGVTGAVIGTTITAAAFSTQASSCTKVIVNRYDLLYNAASTWY